MGKFTLCYCIELLGTYNLIDYWARIIKIFSQYDTDLSIKREFSLTNRKEKIRDTFFEPDHRVGLTVLIVGCYHTHIFNKPDFVQKAKNFLDSTKPEEYMLITACNEEVMFAKRDDPKGSDPQYENRFLNLIFDKKYENRVFPMRLPARPEFHFSGSLVPEVTEDGKKNYDNKEGCVGFETHHFECDEIRTRIDSRCVESFLMAFRSFARYAMSPGNVSRCLIDRNLKSYKKYSPEFFFVYRQQPPYLRKRIDVDFTKIFGKQEKKGGL
ncbi:hypothetical protein ES703_14628 [subsurface metagenome]